MTAMKQLMAYFSLAVTVFLTGLFTVPVQAQESPGYAFALESVELFDNPIDMKLLPDGSTLNSGNVIRAHVKCISAPEASGNRSVECHINDNVSLFGTGAPIGGSLGLENPEINDIFYYDFLIGEYRSIQKRTNVVLNLYISNYNGEYWQTFF